MTIAQNSEWSKIAKALDNQRARLRFDRETRQFRKLQATAIQEMRRADDNRLYEAMKDFAIPCNVRG